MSVSGVYNSSGCNFGSLESTREQAKDSGERVKRDNDARKEEQAKTGLIKNMDGDMVEISSLTDKEAGISNKDIDFMSTNSQKANIGFMESDPDDEEARAYKEKSARMKKIYDKMVAGQKITADEKSFMRKHYPEMAAKSDRMEQEAEQLIKRLQSSKSKEESQQIYLEAKMNAAGELGNKDSSALFIMAAIDSAYAEYNGKGVSLKASDVSV